MKKKYLTGALFLSLLKGYNNYLFAQEQMDEPDTLAQAIDKIQSDLILLNRLKITGYIQAQYQKADTAGIESFAGGNFPANLDSRFAVRRGRFKLAYTNELSQFVLQVDVTEKKVVIKDAYATFTDKWLQTFSVTGGVFDRPFGYEISYSSSNRESPERSRIFQTLFPGERELGAKLTIQPPKTSRFYFFKLEGGLFNGNGPNSELDKYKDFMGHLTLFKNILNENVSVSGGASYYSGGWRQDTKYFYEIGRYTLTDGTDVKGFAKDSAKIGDQVKRHYYGVDGQVSFANNPLGLTTLRGEYINGQQPGTAASSTSPTEFQLAGDAYLRKVSGGYFYFLQNIASTRNQLVLKYDWFDPNTQVKDDQVGAVGSNTGAADLKFTTFGIGWIYRWNSQIKITAYYDMVTNETSSAIAAIQKNNTVKTWSKDRTDNVFTLRVQYKF